MYAPGGEPLVWYEGAGTSDRRWLHADERGSIVAVSDGAGRVLGTDSYDEYGQPAPTDIGRLGYTGQAWLPELNLWYYKARMYAPGLGRFLQTDPIGYRDGLGWYGYVGGDPVNNTDPSGLLCVNGGDADASKGDCVAAGGTWSEDIYVHGQACRAKNGCYQTPIDGDENKFVISTPDIDPFIAEPGDIVVVAQQISTCDLVAAQPGKVFVDFGSASFVAGFGVSGSVGVFKNLKTGSGGFFYTGGGNLGLEAGAGLSAGFYASAADLRGVNVNINVSAGVSGSANFSKDGDFVGGSLGQIGKLGGSVSISNTTFFGCNLQGN